MSDQHNIDRLFQESFKDFEVNAPEGTWSNIEKKIIQNNKKRLIPLWLKVGGVAAIIAIAILAGSQWFIAADSNNSFVDAPKDEILNENDIQNEPLNNKFVSPNPQNGNTVPVVTSDRVKTGSNQNNAEAKKSDELPSTNSNLASKSNTSKDNAQVDSRIADLSNTNSRSNLSSPKASHEASDYLFSISSLSSKPFVEKNQVVLRTQPIEDNKNIYAKPKQKSLVEVAEQINSVNTAEKEKQEKSWFVKPQISPVFYGNLGSGSAVDQNFNQNSAQGEVNVSYGLNVAYKLNNKIKIRTGINRVNLNYNTNDVYVLNTTGFSSVNNVDVAPSFQNSVITRSQLNVLEESTTLLRLPTEESQLQQQLGFIEVPMELEYKLIDKIIDVNIIGGASTLLLNDNSLDVQTGNSTVLLGEANNVNNLSFSTNFAIGLDYDISEKLILSLEPTFKYQINTFQSGTTDFQPFFMGVYSGVVFNF